MVIYRRMSKVKTVLGAVALAAALPLPECYGRNLDALHDVLAEFGAFAAPQLKTQPEVIAGGELKAKVLAASEEVVHAFEATKRAMASVEGRDISADFIKFWTKYRKRALNAR